MYIDPSGEFVITLSMILTAAAISAGVGATIGTGVAMYNDYHDDGTINGSIGLDNYLAYTVGGAVSGVGIGVCLSLGAAAGTAALLGSTATLFTASGISVTFGTALAIGTSTAFITGMAGYSARVAISSSEKYNFNNMLIEGGFNALSGAVSVAGGYLAGVTGFRADYASKLLSRNTDVIYRLIFQNYFTIGIKSGLGYLKSVY